MPAVDVAVDADVHVADSTWVGARPAAVGVVLAQPDNWARWWPEFDLTVEQLRGARGVRWTVRPSRGGGLGGSMEVWLEQALDGVVAHYFLRLSAVGARPPGRRHRLRMVQRYRTRAKRIFWEIGAQVDPGRLARVSETAQRVRVSRGAPMQRRRPVISAPCTPDYIAAPGFRDE